MKTWRYLGAACCIAAVGMLACDGGGSGPTTNVVVSPSVEECDPIPIDPVEIIDASIQGSTLSITASFIGGCGEHVFRVCWNGRLQESMPGIVFLEVIHADGGDPCDTEVVRSLDFDLESVKQFVLMQEPTALEVDIVLNNELPRLRYTF